MLIAPPSLAVDGFAAEREAPARTPRILVFDSGLGGVTVLAEILKVAGEADVLFAADDAVFPYGNLTEAALVARVVAVMEALVALHRPDVVVIACNTASTAVLPPLRARWPAIAFVGTVPAIKPAAALSRSRRISVLATPGTVQREYTRDLVRSFAGDCTVDLVGARRLAGLVEVAMRGDSVDDASLWAEIAPAFLDDGLRRTDMIVLACTHFPLLRDRMDALAPWPVAWIDPAPAIARRVVSVLGASPQDGLPAGCAVPMLFTSGRAPNPTLQTFLQRQNLVWRASAALASLAV